VIELRRLLTGVVLATLALIVMLGAHPVPTETIVAGYALVLGAVLLAALTSAVGESRRKSPSRFEHELARVRYPPTRPPDLVRIEREITLAEASDDHWRRRLRPLLLDIAEARNIPLELETEPAPSRRRIRALLTELERT
jgi:hypothetical protein